MRVGFAIVAGDDEGVENDDHAMFSASLDNRPHGNAGARDPHTEIDVSAQQTHRAPTRC